MVLLDPLVLVVSFLVVSFLVASVVGRGPSFDLSTVE